MKRTFALGLLTAAALTLASPATSVAQEQPAPQTSSQAWGNIFSLWTQPDAWLYNPVITLFTPAIYLSVSPFLTTNDDKFGPLWGSSDIPFLGRA